MYQIIDYDTGVLIAESLNITWLRQQERVDFPVLAYNYNEADGIAVIIDGEEKTLGIKKEREPGAPNMDNYTPLVKVIEIPSDPYLFQQLNETSNKLDTKASQDKVESLEQQTTALMMGMVDVYSKLEAISASIESNNSSTTSSITVETNE